MDMNEEEFRKVLNWIKTAKICIRDDKSDEKDVFRLLDPNESESTSESSSWFDKPYEQKEKTNQW